MRENEILTTGRGGFSLVRLARLQPSTVLNITDGVSQQQKLTRRAPAPILSPQHLALARSLPHSNASTPTPSLLTPPVSGTPAMSPPPRHEGDDYMNVHVLDQHTSRKKQPRDKTRKLHNTREESESSRRPQRSRRSGPQTMSSDGSGSGLYVPSSFDGDENSSAKVPLLRSFARPNEPLHGPQSITEINRVHVQTWPTPSSPVDVVDEADSPSVNALRSLSLKVPPRSNSQGLQRVSTSLARRLTFFKPKPAVSFVTVPSHQAGKKSEEISRRSSAHGKSLAYVDVNPRRPTFKDGKVTSRTLETPATITLRKASKVYATSPITTSMSATLDRECEHERVEDAPACELLAFYSSPTLTNKPTLSGLSSLESPEAAVSLKEHPIITADMGSTRVQSDSRSVSQFSAMSNARRSSVPAEALLTFADVHVAPGSFAVEAKSRRQSLVPLEFNRRISTVHFLSRDSVHEVIWREDETTSDTSLTASSGASEQVGHSFRSTPSSEIVETQVQELAIGPKGSKAAFPKASDSFSKFTKMPETLFQWTWGASSTSAEEQTRAFEPESGSLGPVTKVTTQAADETGDPISQILVNNTSPGITNLQHSSDPQHSRSQRPSFSNILSVQSFPPLRTRSSTAEWQRAPLVDLNDPFAGRVGQNSVQKHTYSAEQVPDVGSDIARGKEGGSLQSVAGCDRILGPSPQVHARLGSIGAVGSSIGISSHKRILSRQKLHSRSDS